MFEGFTEAEILSVSREISREVNSQSVPKSNKSKQGSFGSLSRDLVRAKRRNEVQRKLSTRESKLPAPKEEEEYDEEKKDNKNSEKKVLKEKYKEANLKEVPVVLKSNSLIPSTLIVKTENKIKHAMVSLEEPSVKSLDEFEETRKKLEACNTEKKEQLRQALSDRAKKTHEEVKKLNQIEEELKKIDSSLSNDVSILRNEIESASHDFMEAQKRFNKAEKEYIEAKMELFAKKERKELLTSHLCSIIEQNELRKAKKLSDLMEKLEVPSKPLSIEISAVQEVDKKTNSNSQVNS